tara:strand:- start:1969 stop:2208 length:240 start_codon:yes stop_codon:yes gene_type:complete
MCFFLVFSLTFSKGPGYYSPAMKVRTETVTPILKDRILGEYKLARGNGMNKETAIANVLITVPVTHEKIMQVLKDLGNE